MLESLTAAVAWGALSFAAFWLYLARLRDRRYPRYSPDESDAAWRRRKWRSVFEEAGLTGGFVLGYLLFFDFGRWLGASLSANAAVAASVHLTVLATGCFCMLWPCHEGFSPPDRSPGSSRERRIDRFQFVAGLSLVAASLPFVWTRFGGL